MSSFKIYDENDNFIGEYVGEFFENAKDTVSDSFGTSIGAGFLAILLVLSIKFPWLIIVIIGWGILKLLGIVLKFLSRVLWWVFRTVVLALWWIVQTAAIGIWWIIRFPILFGIYREMPDWWFPKWWWPSW